LKLHVIGKLRAKRHKRIYFQMKNTTQKERWMAGSLYKIIWKDKKPR